MSIQFSSVASLCKRLKDVGFHQIVSRTTRRYALSGTQRSIEIRRKTAKHNVANLPCGMTADHDHAISIYNLRDSTSGETSHQRCFNSTDGTEWTEHTLQTHPGMRITDNNH